MTVEPTPGAPWALIAPVITVSFSGNAFSVIIGRGRFKLPRGHALVGAEAAQVIDDLADLLRRQQVLERRHDLGEGARRAAVGDDGAPLDVGFGRRGRAIAEIRKRGRPLKARRGSAAVPFPSGPWHATHPAVVNLLAGVELQLAERVGRTGRGLRDQRRRRGAEHRETEQHRRSGRLQTKGSFVEVT